jgi:hypothetical protein
MNKANLNMDCCFSEMAYRRVVVLELLTRCGMISGAGRQVPRGNPSVGALSSTKD